ncbi:Golgi apparatus membrane protein tvp18 [Monascus purpureus]|uniref:Golgi apparatus membrane protein tvp18 n=1 Tax=Monascus purpureus TaxID=5098 RepID=A0A507QWP0_MONPU|nr:Golgi apparatus membrane protein tvp18 [Monascus purpureus]BDD56900.1 Golgi apparatus membrane protein tvp18 [Monascus purpureus]
MTFAEEFRSRNFSIYGQWSGVICIILCLAFGIANIITLHALHLILAIICLVSAFIIVFVEVPFLLRICPTSPKFDEFIRRFTTNWMRAAIYTVMSVLQWLSLISGPCSLLVPAIVLLIPAICYALAGLKSQDFVGSKALGGQGLAQMIV